MSELLTSDPGALRLLMTEEIFMVKEVQPVVPVNEPGPPVIDTPADLAVDFTYLGENNKYFLILVEDQNHAHLTKEHQEMLLKIIQAKGLELRDVAILNLRRYPGIQLEAIKDFFAPSRIVLFGINPQHIGLPTIASNEPQKAENVKVLSTYHFEEMKNDVNKKRALWNVFKSF